uniref:Bm504 n=1 Tax=Brugia malayi TaxID=6279 RepID=A0A1I9G2S4_BRUMA|nr:Bm504 [Brugia malayi]
MDKERNFNIICKAPGNKQKVRTRLVSLILRRESRKNRTYSYSFKRGTKNEKGWSCRGRPLKTEFGAIMGMKLATTARRKKGKGRVRILLKFMNFLRCKDTLIDDLLQSFEVLARMILLALNNLEMGM